MRRTSITTCKVTTWCRPILRHYHIQKELQDTAIWTWRSSKGQHQICLRFWCGEYLCKVTTWCIQFLKSYCVHKATCPWASLKVQKGQTKVIIELLRYVDVKNTPIKLQHHTSNTWEVHKAVWPELVLKVQKRSHKDQQLTCPRFWCGEYC